MIDLKDTLDFFRGRKVFLTGHTGFKGSWLSLILSVAEAELTGYALDPPTDPSLFDILSKSGAFQNKLHSITGDIRDAAELSSAFEEAKPEIVIHMAAQPIVLTGYQNPVYTYDTNVMGTVNILECVRMSKSVVSFLNVTTDKVYLNGDENIAFRETDPLDGFDPYSNSKSCSELVTHSYTKSFFSEPTAPAVSTARAGNVIGGGDFAEHRIIPDCMRAALGLSDKTISLRNPQAIRPFQHVLEPLFAYLLIVQQQYKDKKNAGYYNVGPLDRDCVNTITLASCFADTWNGMSGSEKEKINIVSDPVPNAPKETDFLRLDCSYIASKLGWTPRWTVDEAVRKTVEWTKAYAGTDCIAGVMQCQIDDYLK